MTSRILPKSEWPRLAHTLLSESWEKLPDSAIIAVVEDADGQIIGCSALFQQWHQEGTWIAPDYRTNPAAGRALLTAMRRTLDVLGIPEVCMMATDDGNARLIRKFGTAIALTAQHFAVSVSEGRTWQIQ